jgi:hypothetical protein
MVLVQKFDIFLRQGTEVAHIHIVFTGHPRLRGAVVLGLSYALAMWYSSPFHQGPLG